MTAELERWHDSYVLIGTAGATLLGLQFIALSLGAGFLTEEKAAATRTFYSRDYLAYGLLPVIGYLALLAAATMIFKQSEYAPDVLAGAVLLLLIINIRNTWDLMLSMVRHSGSH